MAEFERRYIADYMREKWPRGGYGLNVPLGPIPESLIQTEGLDGAIAKFRPWRPEIDAVYYSDAGLILIEAKVFKTFDAIGKLRMYNDLVTTTPEFRPWYNKPIQLRLVTPRITQALQLMANALNIIVDVYLTDAVKEHAQHYEEYWTREATMARQERKAKMKAAGIV